VARTGRPPRWKNVDEFIKECNPDGFFKWCDDEGHKYLWEWFAVYCKTDRHVILDYAKKDGMTPDGSYNKKQDFSAVIKRIGEQINSYMIDNGLDGKYRDALTIFYLKNYGYSDKQEIQADMTVNLTIGGGEDLFN
jgi:hypothetical protein